MDVFGEMLDVLKPGQEPEEDLALLKVRWEENIFPDSRTFQSDRKLKEFTKISTSYTTSEFESGRHWWAQVEPSTSSGRLIIRALHYLNPQ